MKALLYMAVVAAICIAGAHANAASLPCFDEFHQIYEYDDGARLWLEVARPICGKKPIPGDPGRKGLQRGRIEIKRSGSNIRFVEDTYTWVVEHQAAQLCTGAREVHERTTKVVVDGNYYELVEKDGKPARRKQEPRNTVNISNIPKVPADLANAPYEDLGTSTIAGHTCQRYRVNLGASADGEFCVMQLAPKCPAARSLLSLEQIAAKGSKFSATHGRTIFLKTGGVGHVLAPGAISPP